MEIKLGNVVLETPKTKRRRMAMVIWGPSGSGKTTLACTAPGKKLLVLFDPDGSTSLGDRDDVYIADFSDGNPNIVMKFKSDNPASIKTLLEDHPEIETVIFDSVTSFNELALKHGITEVKGATLEMPTLQGYGRRNSYTMQAVANVLKCTSQLDRHCIIICHEDAPSKDELTGEMFVSILVGGKLQEEIPIKFSEVWHLRDYGKERKITIRSNRMRKPMKTRMFSLEGESEFVWKFNAESGKGEGIAEWYHKWNENNGAKIPIPK